MPRIKSEISEDFTKILDDAGFFQKEAYPSLEAYKDDPDARVGSDTISTIEALYGVKPENIDSMDYESNIMEAAHPNSVVIAPSYDKLNGLVENNIERNNIITNIVLSPTTGHHTNHKYARKELMLELVRVANEMDNKNNDLFKLADDCLIALSKENDFLAKKGIGALGVAGIALGIATILGATWLLSHTSNADQGPLANADAAIKALTNLKTNSWYESDVDETVQKEADVLIYHINQLKGAIIRFNKIKDLVYKPRTLSELQELIKLKNVAAEHSDNVADAVNTFKRNVMEIEPLLSQAIENFSDEYYQKQHTKPSTVSEMTGWLSNVLRGPQGLIANDFVSAVNALKPLLQSLEHTVTKLENFDKAVAKYEQAVLKASSKFETPTNVSSDTSNNTQQTNAPTSSNNTQQVDTSTSSEDSPGSETLLNHVIGLNPFSNK